MFLQGGRRDRRGPGRHAEFAAGPGSRCAACPAWRSNMTVTREEIAAFADGELDGRREAAIGAVIAAEPALAEQLRTHRELKARLGDRFARVLDEPVPERL